MTSLFQLRDGFFISEVVGQREGIDARRHAILRGLVAELDDFLDHLAFRFVERALLFAHLDERLEFLVAHASPLSEMTRRETVDDRRAEMLEKAAHAIEQWH